MELTHDDLLRINLLIVWLLQIAPHGGIGKIPKHFILQMRADHQIGCTAHPAWERLSSEMLPHGSQSD